MKISEFLFENFPFWVVKFLLYVNRHVFVMNKQEVAKDISLVKKMADNLPVISSFVNSSSLTKTKSNPRLFLNITYCIYVFLEWNFIFYLHVCPFVEGLSESPN